MEEGRKGKERLRKPTHDPIHWWAVGRPQPAGTDRDGYWECRCSCGPGWVPGEPAVEVHPCMRGSNSPGGQVGLHLHPESQGTHASLPWASCKPPAWNQRAGLCLLALFRGSRLPGVCPSPGRMAKSKDRGHPGAPNDVHLNLHSQRLISSLLHTSPSVHVPTRPPRPPELSWTLLGVGGRAFIRLV